MISWKKIFAFAFVLMVSPHFLNASIGRMHKEIEDSGVPFYGISYSGSEVSVDFKTEATDQQKAQAQAIVENFDWSAEAAEVARIDAYQLTPEEILDAVESLVVGTDSSGKITKEKVRDKIKEQKGLL